MEDINILEAVERYISGQMSPDERMHFEQLRKTNPDVDQAVVEHTFFLQQLNQYDETRRFRSSLNETHIHLAEKGLIRSPRLRGKARVAYLYNRYKKVAAIAASIAGITALTISALMWSVSPVKPNNKYLVDLRRNLHKNEARTNQMQQKINQLDNMLHHVQSSQSGHPDIQYKSGGTGFLISTGGLIITNSHVVEKANHIAVQAVEGPELRAVLLFKDPRRDLAILQIQDPRFEEPPGLPYGIRRSGSELAEQIFTLGFPRNEIVFGAGYVAARTGFRGDTLSCQIAIPANHGNSGSPVLNRNGEIIGIINNKEPNTEGAVFAIQSKYIFDIMDELQTKDSSFKNLRLPVTSSIRGLERMQQAKKVADYIYMVKVD